MRRPLFKYFGSKFRLAKHYPEPTGDTILELFAGSAGYSLMYYKKNVVLCEKDSRIASLWRWLIDESSYAYIKALPDFSKEAVGTDIFNWCHVRGFPQEAAELVIRWQRAGRGDCPTISKWNNKPGLWSCSTRDYVAEATKKIRHWGVLKGCALEWPRDYFPPKEKITLFVDPPYQCQSSSVYRERFSEYAALSEICLDPGWHQVLVCEGPGADWLPFEPFKTVKNSRTGHNGRVAHTKEYVYHRLKRHG